MALESSKEKKQNASNLQEEVGNEQRRAVLPDLDPTRSFMLFGGAKITRFLVLKFMKGEAYILL